MPAIDKNCKNEAQPTTIYSICNGAPIIILTFTIVW